MQRSQGLGTVLAWQCQRMEPGLLTFDAADALALVCSNVSPELSGMLPLKDDVLNSLLELSKARQAVCDSVAALNRGTILQSALSAAAGDLLQHFYEDIANVESDVLADCSLTVYHVRAALGTWTVVLPDVGEFLQFVLSRAIASGSLLDQVYLKSQDGDQRIASVYKEFISRLHKPFFSRLMQWMAFARLDPRASIADDFFISGPSTAQSSSVTPLYLAVTSNVLDGSVRASSDSDDRRAGWGFLSVSTETALEQSPAGVQRQGMGGTCMSTHAAVQPLVRGAEGGGWLSPSAAWGSSASLSSAYGILQAGVLERTWVTGYTLQHDKVPTSHFPIQLAETVLAVGKAMTLLQTLPGPVSSKIARVSAAALEEHAHAGGLIQEAQDGGQRQSAFFAREDSLAVQALVSGLRSSPHYSQLAVQVVIDRVTASVYSKLLATLVHGCDLGLHVRALRAFALLGRGDFYGTFVDKSRQMVSAMSATGVSALQAMHSVPWRAAALAVGLKTQEGSIWGEEAREDEEMKLMEGSFVQDSPATCSASLYEHDAAVAALFPSRVSLRQVHKAYRMESPGPIKIVRSSSDNGRAWETDSIRTESSNPPARHPSLHSISAPLFKAWCPSSPTSGASAHGHVDPSVKVPRGQATLLLAGSARLLLLWCSANGSSSAAGSRAPSRGAMASGEGSSQHHTHASMMMGNTASLDRTRLLISHEDPSRSGEQPSDRFASQVSRIVLASPPGARSMGEARSESSRRQTVDGGTGAVWLNQPIHASQGFSMRTSVLLMLPKHDLAAASAPAQGPAVVGQAQRGPQGAPRQSTSRDTVSFAVVMHRDLALSLGQMSPSSNAGPVRPTAGMDGIPTSIAAQVIVRRLGVVGQSNARSGPTGTSEGTAAFRVVCAVHGPPRSDRPAGGSLVRDLLAPAAAVDVPLQQECEVTSEGSQHAGQYDVYPLHLCLQYTHDVAGSGGLTVSVLSAAQGLPADSSSIGQAPVFSVVRPCLVASESRTDHLATHTVLDIPLVLEDVLPMGYSTSHSARGGSGGQYTPGRGRLYVGLTSETVPSHDVHMSTACVCLEALDVYSASNADAGWSGLYPHYSLPWPLPTVLPTAVQSIVTDVGRFALRVRTVQVGLNQVWRALMDACTRGDGHGAASVSLGDAGTGVSAQISGAGGKRSRDPKVVAQAASRRELQESLRAVFALRAKLAYVVEAINDHLQIDVISSSFTEYSNAVARAPDFASVITAGQTWAVMLSQGAFLSQPSALDCLYRALDLCEKFTATVLKAAATDLSVLIASCGSGQSSVLGGLCAPLLELSYSFSAEVRYLTQGVAGMAALRGGADAQSLLQRLDFNAFFSMEATRA